MNRKVLLLEPNYKNKFPPIGLMKLATYFKLRGDDVVFYKGDLKEFVIRQITDECVEKLYQLDSSIQWRLRADKIAQYIKYRKQADLERIGLSDSKHYAPLLYPCVEYYKKFFHSKEYKRHPRWDWVGVTTLFTFYWDITIETIEFAKLMVKDTKNLMVGGVLASIQPEQIEKATGIKPHCGTLHTKAVDGKGGDIDPDNPYVIDELPLDYSILDEIDYVYPDGGSYYSYSTRGCIRHCPFCAVPTLEPQYQEYLPLKERISRTARYYGEQQDLLLMDNNVLASPKLPEIIEDIKSCGFTKGAKFIEPNQYEIAIRNLRRGVNDRAYVRKCYYLLNELNGMRSLSEEVRTRIYSIREKHGLLHPETCTKQAIEETYKDFERAYVKALKMSVNHGMRNFSNYLLYNFKDKPEDLYHRLRINVDLCEELDVDIYSFPMKYHPINGEHSHDRDYVGENWNRKYIRAVQAILNATKGKIGRGMSFFERAFGRTEEEYMEMLLMPETFIIFRFFFEEIGYTARWRGAMYELSDSEREELYPLIFKNDFNHIEDLTDNKKFRKILAFYKDYRKDIADHKSELFKMKQEYEAKHKTDIQ